MGKKRGMLEKMKKEKVVSLELLKSKKHVWVAEASRDGMYAVTLNKEELGWFIDELKELRGRME